ncbi:MAG: hypothetical protein JWO46_1086 [Nocardioidaceae bacterium]|nr:hypothetical protein [Nocardioidaceae bacterium]
MRTRTRWGLAVFALAVLLVGGIGVAMYHNVGPLPLRETCTADVGGHHVDVSPDQARNASLISAIGVRRGLPARAVSIALATAYQESKLSNLDHGDRDSLGLFQQRPSQGWGTAEQVQDPYYATNKFFEALEQIDGYQTMRITEAAHKVQRSGFPEAYQPHAADARALASALTGYSPGGTFTCVYKTRSARSTRADVVADLERGFGGLQVEREVRQDFNVVVGTGPDGQRRGWAIAQYLVAHASRFHVRAVAVDGKHWKVGTPSKDGWTTADTKPGRVTVSLG